MQLYCVHVFEQANSRERSKEGFIAKEMKHKKNINVQGIPHPGLHCCLCGLEIADDVFVTDYN
jgi:hypothetical protein